MEVTWLTPILNLPEQKPRRRTPDTSKEVVVGGVRYRSMTEACNAMQCSFSKLYRMLGEGWRYAK